MLKRLRSFADKPSFTRIWFLPVLAMLAIARLAVALLPFPAIARLLGTSTDLKANPVAIDAAQRERALVVGRTVRLAARHAVWRADCYPQAITAAMLLRLYQTPYCIAFGVQRSEDGAGLLAHCWVASGDVAVTGGGGNAFTAVGAFQYGAA